MRLGPKLKAGVYQNFLIESGVCASISLEKVMSGKHFNRALRIQKLTKEALERLLLCKFKETADKNDITLL